MTPAQCKSGNPPRGLSRCIPQQRWNNRISAAFIQYPGGGGLLFAVEARLDTSSMLYPRRNAKTLT